MTHSKENDIETTYLLSVPGTKESIQEADKDIEEGNIYSFDDIFQQ